MNDVAPVELAASWDDLIAAVARHPSAAALAGAAPGTVKGVLAAPAAIAWWLARSKLQSQGGLRVLVIGAEKLDAVDEGRWYQLVPALLGRPFPIEVTLIGDRLNQRFDSPLRSAAPATPARLHVGSLSHYLASHPEPAADVAFLFHPGFHKYRGWLEDGSLARLDAFGIRLVTVSYEADESELERCVVGCYGFDAVTTPLLNPFYVDFSDAATRVHWGRALWQFWPRAGASGAPVDQTRLDAIDRLGEMVMHSIDLGQSARASHGQTIALKTAAGDRRKLVYVFDEFLLDPTDLSLHRFDASGLAHVGTISAADRERYPGETAPELERALWAAHIKARYLLDRYHRRVDASVLRQRARAMHAELEGKVERLFRS